MTGSTKNLTSLLTTDDLTDYQICQIIIKLARSVIKDNGGEDIKITKEKKKDDNNEGQKGTFL